MLHANRLMSVALSATVCVLLVVACAPTAGSAPTSTPAPTVGAAGTRPGATTASAARTLAPATAPAATPAAGTAPTASATETREVKNVTGGLEKLKSYSLRAIYAFEGKNSAGQPQKGSINIAQEVVNTTKDMHLKVEQSGDVLGAVSTATPVPRSGAFETYTVNGNTFAIRDGKCQFLTSGDPSTSTAAMVTPDQFIGSNKGTLVRRSETVNGVIADHFIVTEASLSTYLGGLKLDKGDVWISPDGYIVKMVVYVSGTNASGATGAGTFNYDVGNINSQPPIVAPPDCVAPVQAADIPFPSNVTDKRVLDAGGQTVTSFKSPDSVKMVADFYRSEMPGKGWKLDGDRAQGDVSVSLAFSKDGGKRVVTVNVLSAGGSTSAIISDKTTP